MSKKLQRELNELRGHFGILFGKLFGDGDMDESGGLFGRVAELERRLDAMQDQQGRIAEQRQYIVELEKELESRQPAPEPEQQERWEFGFDELGNFHAAHYAGHPYSLGDVIEILNAHGITPDTPPIDREQGRGLVRRYDDSSLTLQMWIARQMRDYISSLVGEGE